MAFKKQNMQNDATQGALPSGVVEIRGKGGKVKQYSTVALRIKQFWDDPNHAGWQIVTKLISREADAVVMRCKIINGGGTVIATGHSEEWRGMSDVNSTSALENAETSAIGRALAALGIGGESFASADEVQGAMQQQDYLGEIRAKYAQAFETAARFGYEALNDFYELPLLDGETELGYKGDDIRRAMMQEMPKLKRLAEEADEQAEQQLLGQERQVEE